MNFAHQFYHQLQEEAVKKYYGRLRQFFIEPRLVVKRHSDIGSVEWLSGEDLTKGLDQHWPSAPQPEIRALELLHGLASLYGMNDDSDAIRFRRRLALKHVLHSRMGTHCIFELRERGREILENIFVVHFDQSLQAVFVSSVYQLGELIQDANLPKFNVPDEVQKALPGERAISVSEIGWVYSPDWTGSTYREQYQVKVVTDKGDHDLLLDPNGEHIVCNLSKHAESKFGVGRIYGGFWPVDSGQAMASRVVVLRDLHETRGTLAGPFAKVIDEIDPYWKAEAHQLTEPPDADSLYFDRVMAYYHVDLIQRYFRELGLNCLDEYPHLNPLQVHLIDLNTLMQRRTSYAPVNQNLYLSHILNEDGYSWTDARDARTIYHEYTHAVTDAVARLGRSDTVDRRHGRLFQILQARAMDEGIADYFACSLTARHGAAAPQFGYLRSTSNGELEYVIMRDLRPAPGSAEDTPRTLPEALTLMKAQCDAIATNDDWKRKLEEFPYAWGVHWGRYLWRLRSSTELGPDLADMLIANSLFFMTRWSDFSVGVWALVMADRLLFAGVHEKLLLDTAGLQPTHIGQAGEGDLPSWANLDYTSSATGNADAEGVEPEAPSTNPEILLDLGDVWQEHGGEIARYRNSMPQAD